MEAGLDRPSVVPSLVVRAVVRMLMVVVVPTLIGIR
jgi:hypothetical protein